MNENNVINTDYLKTLPLTGQPTSYPKSDGRSANPITRSLFWMMIRRAHRQHATCRF